MKVVIGIGIAVVAAGLAIYLWQRSKKRTHRHKPLLEIDTETVDSLSVTDVVQFFKSFELNPNQDQPFIGTDSEQIASVVKLPELNGYKPVLLGSYNKTTDEINPLRLVMVKNIADDIISLMGNDKFVCLT